MNSGILRVLLVTVPSATMYAGVSSFTIATVIISTVLAARSRFVGYRMLLVVVAIIIWSLIGTLLQPQIVDLTKISVYLGFLLLIPFTATFYIHLLMSQNGERAVISGKLTFWLITLGSLVFGALAIGGNRFNNPMFPFIEPSHFFIYLSYLALPLCLISRSQALLIVMCFLTAALLIPNLIGIVVAAILGMLAFIRHSKSPIWLLVIAPPSIVALIWTINSSNYFAERVSLGGEVDNLSALAFLQGYEAIAAYIQRGNFFGSGLGTMNLTELNLYYSSLIYEIGGGGISLADGGFIAVRLVAELGVIGILICIFLLSAAYKSFRKIRSSNDFIYLALISPLLIYPIELLMRSPGLMSPSAILVAAALMSLNDRMLQKKYLTSNNRSKLN